MTDSHDRRGEDDHMRRLLDDAVSRVDPRDTLEEIHMRTTATPQRRRRPWVLGAAGAALATAATVAAVAVVGDTGDTTDEGPGPAGSPSATSDANTTGPTTSAEPTPTEAPQTVTVPVYYVGETPRGLRLFREFHRVEDSDKADAALTEAVTARPGDPDYRSLWADLPVTGVDASFDGAGRDGQLIIDLLTDGATLRERPSGLSRADASLALDQLMYTGQAVVQERAPVQFLVNGERTATLLGEPVNEPLAQSDPLDVQALVWITEPSEGAEVSAPFTVTGVANAFEANVQWELMQGDRVVKEGFTTAAEAFTFAEYSFTVRNVEPGDYTLVVHDSDPSGGAEGGGGVTEDTKQITVR